MKVERKLEENEIICPKCDGIGCTHCCGQGKLDWIQNITGIDKIHKQNLGWYSAYCYDASFEIVEDSPKIKKNKVGDIIRFLKTSCHRFGIYRYQKNKNVPAYARGEYATIIGIYRWVKYKNHTYLDYGRVIQMLTGSKIGHIRRYNISPWIVITPRNKNYTRLKYIASDLGGNKNA